jgi:hypothetical protein
MLRVNLVIVASFAVAICGLCGLGCKKAEQKPKTDPHSAAGILQAMEQQVKLFNDALLRKDFAYIHDYAYYFNGMIPAMHSRLDDAQKQRLRGSLEELSKLTNELDHSAGRRHAEATTATMQRVQVILGEMAKEIREKQPHS